MLATISDRFLLKFNAIKASGSAMLPMRLRPLAKPMLTLPPLIFFAGTVKR
jgi:hypothetical protein